MIAAVILHQLRVESLTGTFKCNLRPKAYPIMTKTIASILLLSCSFSGLSQPKKQSPDLPAILQTAVSAFMADSSRVGISAGIYRAGKTFVYNAGTLEKRRGTKPGAATLYEIGSITKTFTGALLAQAVVDKKVKLDDDIRLYLNGRYPNLAYKGQPVKLYQLINHTSRLPFLLPNTLDLSRYPPDSIPYLVSAQQKNYSKEAFLNDLHGVTLDTIPGTKYGYSNAASQLLGFLLEKIYGRTYPQLLQQYILRPTGMSNTHVGTGEKTATFATGYNAKGIPMPYNPAIMLPAGGIYAGVSDLLKYVQFQLDEKNEVVRLSHQPTFGNAGDFAVGLNWQMKKYPNGIRKIWQSGGTFGFSSYCVIYPELDIGIVLLSNQADRTAQGALETAADFIFDSIQESGN